MPAGRRRVAAEKIDLNGLRAAVAASIDSELPALQELRRVSPGSIVRVVLPALIGRQHRPLVVAECDVVQGDERRHGEPRALASARTSPSMKAT